MGRPRNPICPRCQEREKAVGQAYCTACRRKKVVGPGAVMALPSPGLTVTVDRLSAIEVLVVDHETRLAVLEAVKGAGFPMIRTKADAEQAVARVKRVGVPRDGGMGRAAVKPEVRPTAQKAGTGGEPRCAAYCGKLHEHVR